LVLVLYVITLLAGAVAKYCDEHICVCVFVRLSARISPESHARSLPIFADVAGLLRQDDEIPRGRDSFEGFLPH